MTPEQKQERDAVVAWLEKQRQKLTKCAMEHPQGSRYWYRYHDQADSVDDMKVAIKIGQHREGNNA